MTITFEEALKSAHGYALDCGSAWECIEMARTVEDRTAQWFWVLRSLEHSVGTFDPTARNVAIELAGMDHPYSGQLPIRFGFDEAETRTAHYRRELAKQMGIIEERRRRGVCTVCGDPIPEATIAILDHETGRLATDTIVPGAHNRCVSAEKAGPQ